MKKIVINRCFGGFSLSPYAVKRLAELQGRECYFFKQETIDDFTPTEIDMIGNHLFWSAFDTKDLSFMDKENEWCQMSSDARKEYNERYRQHYLGNRDRERDNPLLIQVVEELGAAANGRCADLKIVEIPDDVEWTIEEYDGLEHIAEKHRTWE